MHPVEPPVMSSGEPTRNAEPSEPSLVRRVEVKEKRSLIRAVSRASAEELVRGFLALFLILTLIALVFFEPVHGWSTPAVASAKTLAIAVIAFYFGLHGATPQREKDVASRQGDQPNGDSAPVSPSL